MIYWSTFTWEAFATLATGAAAVGGAIWIGTKQAKIAQRQAEILSRQVEIAGLGIRTQLFDRRMKVYEATWDLIMAIIQPAAPASHAVEMAFVRAMSDARMLFSPAIEAELQSIWEDVVLFSAAPRACQAHDAAHGDYGPEMEGEHARLDSIAARLETLPALFSNEMGFRTSF